jgi:hypothetical protein
MVETVGNASALNYEVVFTTPFLSYASDFCCRVDLMPLCCNHKFHSRVANPSLSQPNAFVNPFSLMAAFMFMRVSKDADRTQVDVLQLPPLELRRVTYNGQP